ncbi:MAG: protein kinase [Gammaproteobacteria bacterium]
MKTHALRILIIDDHDGYRALLRDHITAEWPRAVVDDLNPVEHGAAIVELDVDQYHVVLLDHKPGSHNGLELLKELRNRPQFPPIVFMTDQGDERLAAASIKNGAADYLPKIGLDGSLLVTTIRECLRASVTTLPKRTRFSNTGQGDSVVGISVKGYEIRKKFSTGAGSVIYLAYSESRQEEVVLKVLYGNYELSEDYEVLERFLIEFQSVAAVSHPNIVNIYDVGVADDHAFIVMEYIRGGSLRERLAQQGALVPKEAFDVALHIADALTAIHQVGILHRDLKPGNVMFRVTGGPPCIIDFGLAKQVQIEQEITMPGKIYGTPYYMSPEQGQGEEIDKRSDFYSLGVLLFEMLTGRKPYVAGTPIALLFKHTHAPIPQLDQSLQDYQPLIGRLLAKDPAGRPATAEQLTAVLNEYKRL